MVKKFITGNYSAAYGAKAARVEVVVAYPITPQTQIVEKLASMVSEGELEAKYINIESEHSAMAACIAASQAGARAFTATSSQGLLLMHEMLVWASGARTPVVMANVNRANGPPWNVWADQSDSVAQRDTGWLQFYCESNQEVLDTVIQSYKIAESKDIMLPAMVIMDAFILSHTSEPVDIPDQEVVDGFLPKFDPEYKVAPLEQPYGFGSLVKPELYMEFKYKIAEATDAARERIRKVDKEFEETFGRSSGGLIEFYKCDDADAVLMLAGTVASTAKEVADEMRKKGKKVGVARLRAFRPFPYEEVRKLAAMAPIIGILDKSYTFGHGGAFASEVQGALYHCKDRPEIKNYIAGIGGRDLTPEVLEKLFDDLLKLKPGKYREIEWVGVCGLGGL